MPELSTLLSENSSIPDLSLPVRHAVKLVQPFDGEHLFVWGKRTEKDGGCRNLIGGGIRKGESPVQAMVREALEEADLRLDPEDLFEVGGVQGNVVNCRGERLLARWTLLGYGGEIDASSRADRYSVDALQGEYANNPTSFSDLALRAIAFVNQDIYFTR